MSIVINSEDIKAKVSGKFGLFFFRTNITIGTTDKFVYKEVSEGKKLEQKYILRLELTPMVLKFLNQRYG